MGTSEEQGERNLEYFQEQNDYLGCERSSKEEAFKHLLKARVIVMGGGRSTQLLSTSYNTH